MDVEEAPTVSETGDNSKVVISPGSSKYYVPICEPALKPFINQRFASLDLGLEFYRIYAANSGFDTRLGTTKKAPDGSIQWKYVYCNREGEKTPNPASTSSDVPHGKSKKRRVTVLVGCHAYIAFRIATGATYVVKHFEEKHTHELCSEQYRHFMKNNRNLDAGHQHFIMNCAKVNVGATKSYRLYREACGGYANIGCTSVEFKNFSRDLRAFASGFDAQMIIENLFKKRETSPAFYFAFDIDEKEQLNRLFWADPICRRNFATFGDVVSLDATYSMNRYNLIFTPFTGIDNHKRIVTFGAGLLSREDVDSYSWLLEKFEDCMARCPRMIMTDQDPGLRIAVERVLKDTRHRLCMWHIMKKIPDKIPPEMKKSEAEKLFRKKLNSIVWDEFMEPDQFDEQWANIMTEFNLTKDSWFTSMYDARSSWIPAFFRDFPLSGLLKTSSVSESVNSFFGKYLKKTSNLVQFFMQYENAIEAQRHAQDSLNAANTSSTPDLKTPLSIEKHARDIYTTKIFLETQEEIVDACFKCRVMNIENNGDCRSYNVHDGISRVFDVVFDGADNSYVCSCKKFVRVGLLCSHIFVLFKDLNVNAIPEEYIHNRWTKIATLKASLDLGMDANMINAARDDSKLALSRIYSVFYSSIGLIEGNPEKMNSYLESITELRDSIAAQDSSSTHVSAKRKLFQNHFRCDVPENQTIFPPAPVKNKGSGRRIKSSKELAIEGSKKPLRLCRKCNQKTNHDSRNCPNVAEESE
ncbi:hypothetical protein CASFOL_006433 [Castilleja foliolosa]|uniref:SWIM-type domain-containing protein n=1 Tax=Castilleja foliolosa TaxID=1961234 RepID=A0ABD3E6C5_9LAMI